MNNSDVKSIMTNILVVLLGITGIVCLILSFGENNRNLFLAIGIGCIGISNIITGISSLKKTKK